MTNKVITLENLSEYKDISDTLLNSKLSLLNEYIVGTQSSATNVWTGVSKDSELKDGKRISYLLPYNATSTQATLNLTLSDGTTTGAIKVFYNGTSNLTSHYSAGAIIELIYLVTPKIEGATKTTGWYAIADRDSTNTGDLRYQKTIKARGTITTGHIIVGNSSGYINVASGVTFDLDYPILFAGTSISSGNTGTNNYLNTTANYSPLLTDSLSGFSGTAHQTVYLVGTLSGKTFTLSSTFLTCTTPTSEDGLYYIPIGIMYDSTHCGFFGSYLGSIFQYKNGAFQLLGSSITDDLFGKLAGNNIWTGDNTFAGTKLTSASSETLGNTTDKTVLSGNQLVLSNGAIFSGTAQNAGLVTRGICGVTAPDSNGGCDKDNLYINYDGQNYSPSTYPTDRFLILNAGTPGSTYGNGVYQYSAVRGDCMKAYCDANYALADELVTEQTARTSADSSLQTMIESKQDKLTAGDGITISNNTISASGSADVSQATTSTLGTIKVANTRTTSPTLTTGSTTSSRYYGVELDSNGKAFVNVPWSDTNTNNWRAIRVNGSSFAPTSSWTLSSYGYLDLIAGSNISLSTSTDTSYYRYKVTISADLSSYAKTSDLSSYAKTSDLSSYAKTSDLSSYAKTSDLSSYVKTSDLESDYYTRQDVDSEIQTAVDSVPSYTLPPATSSTLGGVKIYGTTSSTSGYLPVYLYNSVLYTKAQSTYYISSISGSTNYYNFTASTGRLIQIRKGKFTASSSSITFSSSMSGTPTVILQEWKDNNSSDVRYQNSSTLSSVTYTGFTYYSGKTETSFYISYIAIFLS